MRKADIADYLISNTSISRSQAIKAVDCAFDAIEKALCKGENVYIRGFGTIKTYITKERKARNIYKRTTVIIPARRTVKLVVSKQLKEKMNS
jgi:DNA-binding protein HU-beta